MIAPDMATMLSFVDHRRADRRAGAAGAAVARRRRQLQRHHRRQRHLDLGHAAPLRHRTRRRAPRSPSPRDPRLDAVQGGARRAPPRPRPPGGEGRRGGAEIRRGAGRAARRRRPRRGGSRIAIANSPLVKTAIAGEDANWGRIVMAVGKAGEPADRDRLAIWFGDIRVAARASATRLLGGGGLGLHEERGDRHHRRHRPRHRQRPRSGPATSPRNTSPSTATTGRSLLRIALASPVEAPRQKVLGRVRRLSSGPRRSWPRATQSRTSPWPSG